MKSTKLSVEQLVEAGMVLDGLGAGSDAGCPVLKALAEKINREKRGCPFDVSPFIHQRNHSAVTCEDA